VPLLLGLHVAFLAAFVHVTTRRDDAALPLQRALVVVQFALAFALLWLARASSLPILLILCVIQAIHVWTPRATLAIAAAANVGLYLTYRFGWEVGSPLVATLMNLSFQAFAAITAWFALSAQRARDALAASHADLLATRALLAESARDGERLRLSRELHDVAGHKLTALKLNLAALARDPRLNCWPTSAGSSRRCGSTMASTSATRSPCSPGRSRGRGCTCRSPTTPASARSRRPRRCCARCRRA
jgi:signal transduction histidine kinase